MSYRWPPLPPPNKGHFTRLNDHPPPKVSLCVFHAADTRKNNLLISRNFFHPFTLGPAFAVVPIPPQLSSRLGLGVRLLGMTKGDKNETRYTRVQFTQLVTDAGGGLCDGALYQPCLGQCGTVG
ncbi:hypothetical protein D3C76_422950 [compost metagenome]